MKVFPFRLVGFLYGVENICSCLLLLLLHIIIIIFFLLAGGGIEMSANQTEEAIMASSYNNSDGNGTEFKTMMSGEIDKPSDEDHSGGGGKLNMSSILWHGGSVYDAWFSCASNQVKKIFFFLVFLTSK